MVFWHGNFTFTLRFTQTSECSLLANDTRGFMHAAEVCIRY